jgi:hypothetical protein
VDSVSPHPKKLKKSTKVRSKDCQIVRPGSCCCMHVTIGEHPHVCESDSNIRRSLQQSKRGGGRRTPPAFVMLLRQYFLPWCMFQGVSPSLQWNDETETPVRLLPNPTTFSSVYQSSHFVLSSVIVADCLSIYGVFNDIVRRPGYIASNGWKTNK